MGSEMCTEMHGAAEVKLIKAKLYVRRWPNQAVNGMRVDPKLLEGVNAALDAYVQTIKGRTIPGPSAEERFIPATRIAEIGLVPARGHQWWLIKEEIASDIGILDRVRGGLAMARIHGDNPPSLRRLVDEWARLENNWPSLSAALSGEISDFPVVGRLWESFVAWCQFSDGDESDTLALLGRFSTFYVPDRVPPPSLDKFAALDLARKLEDLRTQRKSGLISEEEAQESSKALMRRQ